jgi:hypothetical protein
LIGREQTPWEFRKEEKVSSSYKSIVGGSVVDSLDAADYSIVGYEDIIRIERKNGFQELFGNMMPKEHKERFEREMEKLRDIPHKYILIETSLNKDALGLSIPQMYKGPPAGKVLNWLTSLQLEYNISWMFVGDCGKKIARTIFDEIVRKYG